MRKLRTGNHGFTLVELVIVIVLAGVIATVAIRKLGSSVDTAQYEQTKKELDQLALAIAGNPDLYDRGARSDFGYVGDVGALPPNLDALAQNPGFGTWDGPYMVVGTKSDGYKRDAWSTLYLYTDTLIRSTGSGSNIDKLIAAYSSDLLANTVSGYIVDGDREMPGIVYRDSILVRLIYPDGSGGFTIAVVYPDAGGNFSFAGVPVGNHVLEVIFAPETDTSSYAVCVTPRSTIRLDLVFPADLW